MIRLLTTRKPDGMIAFYPHASEVSNFLGLVLNSRPFLDVFELVYSWHQSELPLGKMVDTQ